MFTIRFIIMKKHCHKKVEYLLWCSPSSNRDNGSIPGDGRGAGGLDSAMFAHLKRNWSSNSGHSASARPSALLPPNTEGGERATYEGTISYTQYLMNTTHPSTDSASAKPRLAGLRNVKLSVYKVGRGLGRTESRWGEWGKRNTELKEWGREKEKYYGIYDTCEEHQIVKIFLSYLTWCTLCSGSV